MHPYKLVACSFHDQLEALATLRQNCEIVHQTLEGEQITQSRIIDVYSANQADFIRLQNGTIIRMDHLVSVDNQLVKFANSPFSCS